LRRLAIQRRRLFGGGASRLFVEDAKGSDFTAMSAILKDKTRPEAGEVYGAMDMGWAKLVGQIAHAYGK
jgi:hypothetical protein